MISCVGAFGTNEDMERINGNLAAYAKLPLPDRIFSVALRFPHSCGREMSGMSMP